MIEIRKASEGATRESFYSEYFNGVLMVVLNMRFYSSRGLLHLAHFLFPTVNKCYLDSRNF